MKKKQSKSKKNTPAKKDSSASSRKRVKVYDAYQITVAKPKKETIYKVQKGVYVDALRLEELDKYFNR